MKMTKTPKAGTMVKCRFPFSDAPTKPGAFPHYCLVLYTERVDDKVLLIVAYGTSKLDQRITQLHPTLDIPSNMLEGDRPPGPVTHIVCDHMAAILWDQKWCCMDFHACLHDVLHMSASDAAQQLKTALKQRMPSAIDTMEALVQAYHHRQALGLANAKNIRSA